MANRLRPYARVTREAIALLGAQIRLARKQRRMTAQDVAERAGISRTTLRRIETGDLRTEIGLVFEVAAIVGVPLFAPDPARTMAERARAEAMLALLPASIRTAAADRVDDDF